MSNTLPWVHIALRYSYSGGLRNELPPPVHVVWMSWEIFRWSTETSQSFCSAQKQRWVKTNHQEHRETRIQIQRFQANVLGSVCYGQGLGGKAVFLLAFWPFIESVMNDCIQLIGCCCTIAEMSGAQASKSVLFRSTCTLLDKSLGRSSLPLSVTPPPTQSLSFSLPPFLSFSLSPSLPPYLPSHLSLQGCSGLHTD